MVVRGTPKGLDCPSVSGNVHLEHYWTGLEGSSYHGEVGVHPHKSNSTHGYGLKVWRGGDEEQEFGCYYTTYNTDRMQQKTLMNIKEQNALLFF